MGWYRAVKQRLSTKRDVTKTSKAGKPVSPTSPAPRTSGTVISSADAGDEYEMKDNTIIVVLGASGDLAKKKVRRRVRFLVRDAQRAKTFPALFGLFKQGFLPTDVKIVGYARTKMEDADFHKHATSYLKNVANDPAITESIQKFKNVLSYVAGSYDDEVDFGRLNTHLDSMAGDNRLFYLALPPSVFLPVSKHLKEQCYAKGVNRIIVEKPFGKDLDSARELLNSLKQYWSEEETYRIDHYLGKQMIKCLFGCKEMVKNILVLRFANVAMAPAWDKSHISNVQITFKEPFGTEGRGGYFDSFGIIRDVLQNHLLQVLSILTMERPVSFSAEDIRDEKVGTLPLLVDLALEQLYVGADGKPGYLEDDTVPRDSVCPTFAATTLWINNPRWEGVPFILRAGKALNEAKVEVRVQFKDVTQGIFKDITRNELVIRIQPSEAVYLKMNTKTPGLQTRAMATEMDLTYNRRFADAKIPEAYEALILDALQGDHSNFVRHDELDVAWKIFTPILHWIDGQSGERPRPVPYGYGSRGPAELNAFVERYGYQRTAAT
ncbi:glucose-6-P dehydrogenase [Mycena vulgaris]|nr:glucose-6-P dehydrogenase [Mycena vulgaris]